MPDKIEERYNIGMKTRREVLGDKHVDNAISNANQFDAPFQEMVTLGAWGTVWSREHWTKRERSMVTISILAALGREEELALHIRATQNTGASADDIREALMHVAIYAGVPAANSAFRVAKSVLAEIESDDT